MDIQPRKTRLLSLVIPLYNEQAVIAAVDSRLVAVVDRLDLPGEIVYVNDGSTDRSLSLLLDLRLRDERIAIVDLSRNFGKELALTAGLDYAHGDAVVIIDADLQDPPELIPELLKGWEQGYDVVSARRIAREGESWLKRLSAAVALLSFAYAAVIIYKTLAYGDPARGYPSLMVTILFLGGVQLLSLGVIGEYLGRIFNETKRRPLYLVNRYLPAAEPTPRGSDAIE